MKHVTPHSPHILYIEDDRILAHLVEKSLQRFGFEVSIMQDGASGKQALKDNHYDAVILDYHLPDCTGLSLVEELAPQEDMPPILVLSGAEELDLVVAVLKAGAADYIVKGTDATFLQYLPTAIGKALEQAALKRKLKDQEKLLRLIIDNIPHSVFWKDVNGVYLGCNKNFAASAMLDNPREIEGKSDYDLIWAEMAEHFQRRDRTILENGPRINHEVHHRHEDGHESTFLTSSVPLSNEKEQPVGTLSIFVDISDRKKTEEALFLRSRELEETNTKLEETNNEIMRVQEQLIAHEKLASLGTMTAGIAHEIRNPLNFISNLSQINEGLGSELRELLDPQTPITNEDWEEIQELLRDLQMNSQIINKHSKQAENIVKGMMGVASGGKTQFSEEDLNKIIDEYVHFIHRGKQTSQTIIIETHLDPSIGVQRIVPQNLGRVLINLFNNAVDALTTASQNNKSFTPLIRVHTINSQNHYQIIIEDNGPGIDKDIIEKIFDPFFTTRQAGSGNAGLGLSICYDVIVNEHGGELQVKSEPYQSTQFIITLPKV